MTKERIVDFVAHWAQVIAITVISFKATLVHPFVTTGVAAGMALARWKAAEMFDLRIKAGAAILRLGTMALPPGRPREQLKMMLEMWTSQ